MKAEQLKLIQEMGFGAEWAKNINPMQDFGEDREGQRRSFLCTDSGCKFIVQDLQKIRESYEKTWEGQEKLKAKLNEANPQS